MKSFQILSIFSVEFLLTILSTSLVRSYLVIALKPHQCLPTAIKSLFTEPSTISSSSNLFCSKKRGCSRIDRCYASDASIPSLSTFRPETDDSLSFPLRFMLYSSNIRVNRIHVSSSVSDRNFGDLMEFFRAPHHGHEDGSNYQEHQFISVQYLLKQR